MEHKEPWEQKLEGMEESYVALEKSGHIEMGAVSENVNWEEIKLLFKSALASSRDAALAEAMEIIEGKKKTLEAFSSPSATASYNRALEDSAAALSALREGK